MKKFLITMLFLMFVSCPVFANTAFDSAMKSATAALAKKDYITAEKYYGIAAREFNKIDKNPIETIKATAPAASSVNAAELKANMTSVKQFSDDIQKVYYLSKDSVTKEFLYMLVMVEDGAKLLVDHPDMLELTNQMLKKENMQDVTTTSDKNKKEQADFLKGMYGKKLKDIR